MERLNKENMWFTVEGHFGYGLLTSEHTEEFCTWEEARELFNKWCDDEDVVSCGVYYRDSRNLLRTALEYNVPHD